MNCSRLVVKRLFDMITGRRKVFAFFFVLLMQGLFLTDLFAQTDVPFVIYDNGTLTFDYGVKPAEGEVYGLNVTSLEPGWIEHNPSVTKVVFTENFSKARPTSCTKWFDGCSSLEDGGIVGIENLNTSAVDHFYYTFAGCDKLTTIDVSHFDTSNAIIFTGMFNNCAALKSLDLVNFNTAKAQWIHSMFGGCESLANLDLRSFDTRSVTQMNQLFAGCINLKSIYVDADKFLFPNLGNNWAQGVFSGCESLEGAAHYDITKPLDPKHDQREYLNYTTGYLQKIVGYQGDEAVGAAGDPLKIVDLDLKDKAVFSLTDNTVAGARRASYSRDVTSDWGTLCLPFAIDVTDEANDCWFYPMEKVDLDKGRIPVTRMTEGVVEAGVPVFVKRKDPAQTAIHVVGMQGNGEVDLAAAPVNATTGDRLVGTFTAIAAPKDDNAYFIAKDKFRNVVQYTGKDNTKGVKVYGYRAYIMADDAVSGSKPALLGMFEGNGVTGMTCPEIVETVGTDAECFDLQGCRTGGLRRGVNIVRTGSKVKKVIVR